MESEPFLYYILDRWAVTTYNLSCYRNVLVWSVEYRHLMRTKYLLLPSPSQRKAVQVMFSNRTRIESVQHWSH